MYSTLVVGIVFVTPSSSLSGIGCTERVWRVELPD